MENAFKRKGGQITKVSNGRIIIRTDVNKMQQKLKGTKRLTGRRQKSLLKSAFLLNTTTSKSFKKKRTDEQSSSVMRD